MPASREGRRAGATWLPAVVIFTFVTAVAIAGFVITRNVAEREEERLLHERASEIAAILSTAGSLASSLELIGAVWASDGGESAFAAGAGSLVVGNVTAIAVVELDGSDLVVRAMQGVGPAVGDRLVDERADVGRRALNAGGLVSTLIRGEELSTLIVALGRSDGSVVMEDALFASSPAAPTVPSPFAELDAVLYRVPTADPANLLIATTDRLPMEPPVDSRVLPFGAEQWLLETSARSPLASTQSRAVPWIILAAGLAAAIVAAGMVVLVSRRRAYAMRLVDQRTSELRTTMVDLEGARAEADAANRAKSEFLSRMSHELRTPLNAVLGFAQLLEAEDLSADNRDAVDHILKGGNHLLGLINEVLDISRIESGDLALSPESVSAAELIDESIDLMRPLATQRSVHFVDGPRTDDDLYVFADRQRLKQVLLNLLSNGVKYNRSGGSLSVSYELTSPTRVRIDVTDTGPGISEQDAALLFVPFERLGASRSDIEGTGIGLALSRRLAEAMGGTLTVSSRLDHGSTFSIELPVVEGTVERYERLDRARMSPVRIAPADQRRQILYIEDNLANITLIERILSSRGDLELVPAMQGRLGVELARQHRPALILMDLHLPDVDGEEVLKLLREHPDTRPIPVIVVSADASISQVQRLKSAGATAYFTKPYNVREFLAALDELLPSAVPSTHGAPGG